MNDEVLNCILSELKNVNKNINEICLDINVLKNEMVIVNTRLNKLEDGQKKLKDDVKELKIGQMEIREDIKEIKNELKYVWEDIRLNEKRIDSLGSC